MPLVTCKLCRKIFTAAGGRVCPDCQQRLDELYPRVRQYLRDNHEENFNVETLAEEMGADVRDIQGLIDLGYLEREPQSGGGGTLDSSRQRLAKELEQAREQMRAAAAQQKPVSYGQTLYGDKSQGKKR